MSERPFPLWIHENEEPALSRQPTVAPPLTVREAPAPDAPEAQDVVEVVEFVEVVEVVEVVEAPDAPPERDGRSTEVLRTTPELPSVTGGNGPAGTNGRGPVGTNGSTATAATPPAVYRPDGHGSAIEVEGVSKWFKDVVAVSDISCTIGFGVTALLGPNGAGKSTLFRMLCGLTPPSRGTVRVLGGDPRKDIKLTRTVGLVPQQEGVFEPLTAFEFVRLAGILHGLEDPGAAAVEALTLVDLDPADTRLLTDYSKGMRQRVKVAQALVHDPEVLFLDEPLNGLDPRQRLHLVDLIQRLGDSGKCVVVSSHVLEEVERFSARVLVIVKGRLAAEGDFRAIRELMDDRPHRISVRCSDGRTMATGLMAHAGCAGVEMVDGQTLLVETNDAARFRHTVAAVAKHYDVQLFDVSPLDDDLESVFRYLVGP